ncbi:MAG: aldo/keto reductase [Candidatus Goldiibacteriota bacterium]|jgi:aryl-alcohol dehydrogenase-like predicted oxidoreductase
MQKRKLGWTGLELSVIGLGTWAAGGGEWKFGWGPQDDGDTIKSIHEALDCGINWIDTAAVYGLGHSEIVVGRAVKNMRERVILATKCERRWNADGSEIFGVLKKNDIKKECEDSLKRLSTGHIDLYQIHWPNPEEDIVEGWEAINELIKEGKVRFGGVSNFSTAQMEKIWPSGKIASLQPPYSMLRRSIEGDQTAYCAQNNIGMITYSPMEKGLLTGKVTMEWVKGLPESDHRKRDNNFNEPQLSKNLALLEKLKNISEKAGITLSQLAIAWVLRRPEITAAIVGARKPGQIKETAPAGDATLADDIIKEIDGILAAK